MIVRSTQYDLGFVPEEKRQFMRLLEEMAFSQSEDNGWKKYVMPGGKVQVSVRDSSNGSKDTDISYVTMGIRRTTLFEPGYITDIVNRLGVDKKRTSSGSFSLAGIVNLYLGNNTTELVSRGK